MNVTVGDPIVILEREDDTFHLPAVTDPPYGKETIYETLERRGTAPPWPTLCHKSRGNVFLWITMFERRTLCEACRTAALETAA